MPNWTKDELSRATKRNPNLVPSGQVPDAKPQRNKAKPLGQAVQREACGVRAPNERITVRFVGRRVKPLDPDNFAGSVKDLLDGLRHMGAIDGDEPWRIILETEQEKVAHYEEEETLIYITWPKEHQSND